MLSRLLSPLALVLWLLVVSGLQPVAAQGRAGRAQGEWTLYGGQMIANDLPPLAFDLVRGRVRGKSAYLVGLGYSLPLMPPPGWLDRGLAAIGIPGTTAALDLIAVQ